MYGCSGVWRCHIDRDFGGPGAHVDKQIHGWSFSKGWVFDIPYTVTWEVLQNRLVRTGLAVADLCGHVVQRPRGRRGYRPRASLQTSTAFSSIRLGPVDYGTRELQSGTNRRLTEVGALAKDKHHFDSTACMHSDLQPPRLVFWL